MVEYRLFHDNCIDFLEHNIYPTWEQDQTYDCLFMDPPDNLNRNYNGYNDSLSTEEYIEKLRTWVRSLVWRAHVLWISFNAKWILEVANIVQDIIRDFRYSDQEPLFEMKPCVQTLTFGQHNQHDLGINHRPLWRINWIGAKFFPNAIRVPSCRQQCGDKRADPRGRVPGDVFDFPRVTGNSRQRRKWHPTQLNEGLIERCVLFSTPPDGRVLDPFAGTGTTLRVCKRLNLSCTLVEVSKEYCKKIAKEHDLKIETVGELGNGI